WTRGKCAFKLLQYMSSGISAVASPVGVNTEVIDEGVNGLLAVNESEWLDAISKLIEDAGLRKGLGKEARKTIEERYSLRVNAPKLLNVLKANIGRKV
ncbi:MAG: glycosyltransferase family 4 protein, partial [Deltaproteobacteria bacterium]|nr:glycosyltransferase family 4 protein [Deltaproteobacteria bacterium]